MAVVCRSASLAVLRIPSFTSSSSVMSVVPLRSPFLSTSVVPSHVHGVRLFSTIKGDPMERAAENAYMREEEKHQLKQLLAKKQKTQQHEEKNHDTKTLLAILGDSAKHLDEKTIEKLHEWKHSH